MPPVGTLEPLLIVLGLAILVLAVFEIIAPIVIYLSYRHIRRIRRVMDKLVEHR